MSSFNSEKGEHLNHLIDALKTNMDFLQWKKLTTGESKKPQIENL